MNESGFRSIGPGWSGSHDNLYDRYFSNKFKRSAMLAHLVCIAEPCSGRAPMPSLLRVSIKGRFLGQSSSDVHILCGSQWVP